MIKFATKETKHLVRSMWKTVFEDSEEYMDLIFNKKYSDNNTLIYWVGKEAVASLQMTPYQIRFFGENIDCYYMSGLCTLPQYRNRGYMGELIKKSFKVMSDRNIPLSILVPAEKWLFGYYEKYGYIQTFEKNDSPINLKGIIDGYPQQMVLIFERFDKLYQQNDFTLLKTINDLDVIIEENIKDNCSIKYSLNAMSRTVNVMPLLKAYAKTKPNISFTLKVNDNLFKTNTIYKIYRGEVIISQTESFDFEIDQSTLTKLLFGYRIEELNTPITSYFDQHKPVINLMLE